MDNSGAAADHSGLVPLMNKGRMDLGVKGAGSQVAAAVVADAARSSSYKTIHMALPSLLLSA